MNIDINQLEFIHIRLRGLLNWLLKKSGLTFTITSMYRIDDTGVHGTLPLRGIDLRCRNKEVGKQIESLINSNWIYDNERLDKKCAVLHGRYLHLHIQVHNNTYKCGDN